MLMQPGSFANNCLLQLDLPRPLFSRFLVTLGAWGMMHARRNVRGRHCANFLIQLLIICS